MTNILQPFVNCFSWKAAETPVDISEALKAVPKTPKRVRKVLPSRRLRAKPNSSERLVEQLKSAGRYAALLMPQIACNLRISQLEEVVELLGSEMSVIPQGPVSIEFPYVGERPTSTTQIQFTGLFLLDRFAITNAEYKLFVDEGGYDSKELWDPAIAPALSLLVDETGCAAPRRWENGNFPEGKESHPVVGISWHEAAAYARWVGKRLPTRAEWVKAASWPLASEGKPTRQRAFPWGDVLEESSMNVGSTGLHCPVPVDEFQNGNSASDVCQMCGNVWEWIADDFQIFSADTLVSSEDSIKALRGGAFDTYLDRQAACQFESGDNCFSRKPNIGFRCAISVADFAPKVQDLIERLTVAPRATTFAADDEVSGGNPSENNGSSKAQKKRLEESRVKTKRRAKEVLGNRLRQWTTLGKDGNEAEAGDVGTGKKKRGKSAKKVNKKSDDQDDNKPYKSPFAGPGF